MEGAGPESIDWNINTKKGYGNEYRHHNLLKFQEALKYADELVSKV